MSESPEERGLEEALVTLQPPSVPGAAGQREKAGVPAASFAGCAGECWASTCGGRLTIALTAQPTQLAQTPIPAAAQPERTMTISVAHLQPLVALIAGVLILLVPRILNYIVAIYLIIVGIIGLGLVR